MAVLKDLILGPQGTQVPQLALLNVTPLPSSSRVTLELRSHSPSADAARRVSSTTKFVS